jgi:uncharacterized protein YbgA (DUF1722 family)/uncharacterized protein YbbK (DUF523 family)
VGVSSCLLGREVRWDGGHKRDAYLTDVLGPYVEWVPVCPELELGLGVPREPIRLEGDARAPRLVAPTSGTGYVLKKDSPSCGMERVRVHGRAGTPSRDGVGLFARVLMDAMPLLPVEEEGRLRDPARRENFLERVFAYARWKAFRADRPTRAGLVRFHTVHKLLLQAHAPGAVAPLGRVVAGAKARPLGAVLDAYGRGFMAALRVPATPGRHANVLEHMLGWVSKALDAAEREEMLSLIADHRRRLVPLLVPLTLMKHHVRRLGIAWLAEQVYLDPHPKELMLRSHA